jgi:hypothetical protein
MIDSTSAAFIKMTRARVYGSTSSLSHGSTFNSPPTPELILDRDAGSVERIERHS